MSKKTFYSLKGKSNNAWGGSPNVFEISKIVHTVGLTTPRSIRAIWLILRPESNASDSWVIPLLLRKFLRFSPNAFRYFLFLCTPMLQ